MYYGNIVDSTTSQMSICQIADSEIVLVITITVHCYIMWVSTVIMINMYNVTLSSWIIIMMGILLVQF